MNKKAVLIDFCVYLLLLGDEFLNKELLFFNQKNKILKTYQNYISVVNNYIKVENFILNSDLNGKFVGVKSLKGIIDEDEIESLQNYIENDFDFGYPNDINEDGFPYGGTYKLYFSKEEIESFFIDYINLRKLNPSEYITYYLQFINYLEEHSLESFKKNRREIDNFYKNKFCTTPEIFSRLKSKFESQLENVFLDSFKLTSFQVQGEFDEYGLIFNFDKTLKNILNSQNFETSTLNLSVEPEKYFALVNYEYFLIKFGSKKIPSLTKEQKILNQNFDSLKSKNFKQVDFLRNKGFSQREIDIILNCFSVNKYSPTNIRSIGSLKGVRLFVFFYFFYRFDYLDEIENIDFNAQNDFRNLPLVNDSIVLDCNQFKKYYDRVENEIDVDYPLKHSPFYSLDKTKKIIDFIKSELYIDVRKLKIPPSLKKHM